jgi:uncharacterized membrane protein YeaQ/YmgE (transglycosylase-associated protein family)
MNLPTFITLLVVGMIVGGVATLVGKGSKLPLSVNLGVSTTGAFLGWWVLRQINPAAIQAGFALGGSVTLLVLLRTLKK